jgi:hypothetical protein
LSPHKLAPLRPPARTHFSPARRPPEPRAAWKSECARHGVLARALHAAVGETHRLLACGPLPGARRWSLLRRTSTATSCRITPMAPTGWTAPSPLTCPCSACQSCSTSIRCGALVLEWWCATQRSPLVHANAAAAAGRTQSAVRLTSLRACPQEFRRHVCVPPAFLPPPPPAQFIVSQTNPWVVPFLPDNDQPVADMPLSVSGIASRVVHVAVGQLRCAVAPARVRFVVACRCMHAVWHGPAVCASPRGWQEGRRVLLCWGPMRPRAQLAGLHRTGVYLVSWVSWALSRRPARLFCVRVAPPRFFLPGASQSRWRWSA